MSFQWGNIFDPQAYMKRTKWNRCLLFLFYGFRAKAEWNIHGHCKFKLDSCLQIESKLSVAIGLHAVVCWLIVELNRLPHLCKLARARSEISVTVWGQTVIPCNGLSNFRSIRKYILGFTYWFSLAQSHYRLKNRCLFLM